jgi:hypothetical protein
MMTAIPAPIPLREAIAVADDYSRLLINELEPSPALDTTRQLARALVAANVERSCTADY